MTKLPLQLNVFTQLAQHQNTTVFKLYLVPNDIWCSTSNTDPHSNTDCKSPNLLCSESRLNYMNQVSTLVRCDEAGQLFIYQHTIQRVINQTFSAQKPNSPDTFKKKHCWAKLVLSCVNIFETPTVDIRVPAQIRYMDRNTNCKNATANAFAVWSLLLMSRVVLYTDLIAQPPTEPSWGTIDFIAFTAPWGPGTLDVGWQLVHSWLWVAFGFP